MIYLSEDAVRDRLPWEALVSAIETAVKQRGVTAPHRSSYGLETTEGLEREGRLLFMPAWHPDGMIGLKTVVYRPDNGSRGLPTHGANYVLMNARSGTIEAVLEAHELTTRRTAGVSVLAARYLARSDSRRLLIVGTGPVARALAAAYSQLRSLETLEVFGRAQARVEELIRGLKGEGVHVMRCADLEEGVSRADIICMATNSTDPVLRAHWLRPGVHVDLIGSFTPGMREVDDMLIRRADSIWVDTRVALHESGDLVGPLSAGVISEQDISGDLRELVSDGKAKRRTAADITVFKAVGFAVCDLAAAQLVLAA